MDTINKNWYSSEAQKQEREIAQAALNRMKSLEVKFEIMREKVVEKTPFGFRVKYVKKK